MRNGFQPNLCLVSAPATTDVFEKREQVVDRSAISGFRGPVFFHNLVAPWSIRPPNSPDRRDGRVALLIHVVLRVPIRIWGELQLEICDLHGAISRGGRRHQAFFLLTLHVVSLE